MGDEGAKVDADQRLTVYCISLDETSPRWLKTRELFEALPFVDLVRVPGVPGSTLPRTAAVHLANFRRVQGGTMGCFLANVAAWERVASGPGRALIIEDDVDPYRLERVFSLNVAESVDLLFVNSRMAQHPKGAARLRLLPIQTILRTKAALAERNAGTGTDGYMLTPTGAKKLLEAVARDGFFGHVDGRLIRYSIRRSDVFEDEALASTWLPSSGICSDQPPRQWQVVRARRLNGPLVVPRPNERSLRKSMRFSGERSPSS